MSMTYDEYLASENKEQYLADKSALHGMDINLLKSSLTSEARFLREASYPPITDFVDAWVKQDDVALEEYRQACLAVKAKYPKV